MRSKRFFSFPVYLGLLLFLTIMGCRKDFLSSRQSSVENNLAVTTAFLDLPADADHELKLITENLRSAESQMPFLAEFAKQNGYPSWNHVVSNLIRKKRPAPDKTNKKLATSSTEPENAGGFFLIPLIDTVSKEVTAYIACTKYSDTTYNYKTYNKNEILSNKNPADSQKVQMKPLLSTFAYFERVINHKNASSFSADREYKFKNVNIEFRDPTTIEQNRVGVNASHRTNSLAKPCAIEYTYIIIYEDYTFDIITIRTECTTLPDVVVTTSRSSGSSSGGSAYAAFNPSINPGALPTTFTQPGTQTTGYVTPAGFDANSFNHWAVYWSVYAGQAGYVTYLDQLDYMLNLTQDQHDWLFAHKTVTHEITYELQENDYSDEAVMASSINIELARLGFFDSFSETILDWVLDHALPIDLQPYASVFKAYLKYQVAIEREKDPSASSLQIYWRASQELLHAGLDFAGLVPVAGEVFDLANGLTYAISGDWSNASLSLASAIPILGDIPATARIIKRGKELIALRASNNLFKFTRNSAKFRKLLGLVPGDGMIAHHIIPLEVESHALVQMAARNGLI